MRSDIASGGTFPDYELPDHESVVRRLSEIQAWNAGELSQFHGWNRWSPERVAAARSV